MDRLLLVGVKHGPAAKHDVINKILTLAPQLTPGDCWRRIRYLRHLPELAALQAKSASLSRTRTAELHPRPPVRPWSTADNDKLMAWVGYETVAKIAQRLNRSERAVRFRLGARGVSARVTDGWSLRALQKLLRVSAATLRRFIAAGALRVRDPRISAASLAACWKEICATLDPVRVEKSALILARGDEGYAMERAAELLGTTAFQVQNWLCAGRLKVVNSFVTDRAFQDFCKQHGHELNLALMEPGMRKWLASEYGVTAPVHHLSPPVSRAKKHALVIHACRCGRKVAGNAYFRHAQACAATANPTLLVPTPSRELPWAA